jgi:hypothetical protein
MSEKSVPTLDEIEELAVPIVAAKSELCAKARKELEDKYADPELRQFRYWSDAKDPAHKTCVDRTVTYLKHIVEAQKEGDGLMYHSTYLDHDSPPSFVEQLMAKPNICQLISFKFSCRGFRHLRCGSTILLSRENMHQFARCEECYALWQEDEKRPKKRARRARKIKK